MVVQNGLLGNGVVPVRKAACAIFNLTWRQNLVALLHPTGVLRKLNVELNSIYFLKSTFITDQEHVQIQTLNVMAQAFGAVSEISMSGRMPFSETSPSSTSQPDGTSTEIIGGGCIEGSNA